VNLPGAADIREQDYVLGQMSYEQEQAIAAKNLLLHESDSRFWQPRLTRGKDLFGNVIGDKIFTDPEKAEYARQDKMLLTIPELVPKMNALEGMQIAGRRPGVIIAEGAEDAPDTEVANRILMNIQSANQLQAEMTGAFINAMITSYPTFIFFDRPTDWTKKKTLELYHEAWDAVLPDPTFRMVDLSDADRLTRVKALGLERCIENYPEREKVIRERVQAGRFNSDNFVGGNAFTADQRRTLFTQLTNAYDVFARTGLIYIIERQHFVYKNATVYIAPGNEAPELLPFEWSEEEVARWRQVNPTFTPVQRKVRILWVTTCTSTGVLLENKAHWYQENEFAAEMFVPKMLDNMPYGIVEFLAGSVKMKNASRIEHLHSLRSVNDQVMKLKEGAVKNAQDLEAESGRVGGKIIIDKDHEMDDVQYMVTKRENMGWADLSQAAQDDIDRLFMDRNIEGGVQSSQESGKVVGMRIQQNQMKQQPYLSAYNLFDLRVHRKALRMLPYVLTEPQIMRYIDEKNQPGEVELNQPVDFDWITGAVTRVKNNLAGAKYDYRATHGDDSETGKQFELQQFSEVLQNVLPSVPPEDWPFLLSSIPNRLAQEFGRKIQARMEAEANAPKTEPMKKTLSIAAKDLPHNPLAQQILQTEGILPQPAPPQVGSGAGMPPGAANQQASLQPQGVG
jgi:hypothetical protein